MLDRTDVDVPVEEESLEVVLPPGYNYPDIVGVDIKESLWLFEELCYVGDKKGLEDLDGCYACVEGEFFFDSEDSLSGQLGVFVSIWFPEQYPRHAPIVFLPDYTSCEHMNVDELGLLDIAPIQYWKSNPVLPDLIEEILEHIVKSLSDRDEEEEEEDTKKQYIDNTVLNSELSQKSSPNVLECDEGDILEEKKEEEKKEGKELCEVFDDDTERCELVCENLLKKENMVLGEVHHLEEDKENASLGKSPSEKRLELIEQLAQRLEEKMDLIEFEIGALEESNSYLSDQGKRTREELDEVIGHREECEMEMREIKAEICQYDEEMSVFNEIEALSLDDQIRTKSRWYDLKTLLRSEVRAFDDALFILTMALQRKTVKLNDFLSSCREIGRQKFEAKCKMKLVRSRIKKSSGIKI